MKLSLLSFAIAFALSLNVFASTARAEAPPADSAAPRRIVCGSNAELVINPLNKTVYVTTLSGEYAKVELTEFKKLEGPEAYEVAGSYMFGSRKAKMWAHSGWHNDWRIGVWSREASMNVSLENGPTQGIGSLDCSPYKNDEVRELP